MKRESNPGGALARFSLEELQEMLDEDNGTGYARGFPIGLIAEQINLLTNEHTSKQSPGAGPSLEEQQAYVRMREKFLHGSYGMSRPGGPNEMGSRRVERQGRKKIKK